MYPFSNNNSARYAPSCPVIPLKAKHRIMNIGEKTLIFVEVQLGTYFGEDDIIRLEDDYNRE